MQRLLGEIAEDKEGGAKMAWRTFRPHYRPDTYEGAEKERRLSADSLGYSNIPKNMSGN